MKTDLDSEKRKILVVSVLNSHINNENVHSFQRGVKSLDRKLNIAEILISPIFLGSRIINGEINNW